MISSTVTWCRPTVKVLPMKLPPAWLDPEPPPPPPPPEPGPELTNSRRESKNFLMVPRRRGMECLWLQSHTSKQLVSPAPTDCTDNNATVTRCTYRTRPHQASLFAVRKHAVMHLPAMMMLRQAWFFFVCFCVRECVCVWQISHLLANASQLVIARAVATKCYVSELHHPGG